jgi:hypothetical protein
MIDFPLNQTTRNLPQLLLLNPQIYFCLENEAEAVNDLLCKVKENNFV